MVWPIFAPFWQALRQPTRQPRRSASTSDLANVDAAVTAIVDEVARSHVKLRGCLTAMLRSGMVEPHLRYRRFTKHKRDGRLRQLAEPEPALKALQHAIHETLLLGEPCHPAAQAFVRGHSIATHAATHVGAAIIITADIQDFFPTTRADRIEARWGHRFDQDTARLLTLLTTLEDGLPQGAPTSPLLSNLVNAELDERLAQRALRIGARYSRYCDDLAFSWPTYAEPPADWEAGVRSVLGEFGYRLHPTKGWRVWRASDEPIITGVVLSQDGTLRMPEAVRTAMRAVPPHEAERLAGYRGYAAMLRRAIRR